MKWNPLARNYSAEQTACALSRASLGKRERASRDEHPLAFAFAAEVDDETLGKGKSEKGEKAKMRPRQVSDDPLSSLMDDPLSGALSASTSASPSRNASASIASIGGRSAARSSAASLSMAPPEVPSQMEALTGSAWSDRKERILEEFSVTGTFKVTASFMGSSGENVRVDSQTKSVALSQAKMRLEQLDAGNEDTFESQISLTQKECTQQIEALHDELSTAWDRQERVKSLKISIQCSKVLADMSVPAFYPSMWVLVTEILDTFGELVYDRLYRLAVEKSDRGKLPPNFRVSDVPSEAKETCRNWFFKIACIRELLPRIYVEMALIKCYRFLADDEFPSIVSRLANVIRGIGDPLIAAYARAYLTRAGARVLAVSGNTHLFRAFNDYVFTLSDFSKSRLAAFCTRHNMDPAGYQRLHGPAAEWLLKGVGVLPTKENFMAIMQLYVEHASDNVQLLSAILSAFPPEYYSINALGVVKLIESTGASLELRAGLYTDLAEGLIAHPPPQDQRMSLLNEVWKAVSKLNNLPVYVKCSAAFVELAMCHYKEKEVLILLKDLLRHLNPHGVEGALSVSDDLDRVCRAVCERSEPGGKKLTAASFTSSSGDFGFSSILTSDQFCRIMDLFKGEKKIELCKSLLESFTRSKERTSNPVIIHTVFAVAKDLHDSIDALSFTDDRRQISTLICKFIDRIDFGRDLEQQFNLYVDCRAAFSNLDSVNWRLCIATAGLAMRAYSLVKGNHTKKTTNFVKACLAYCHITIPSIDDAFKRLALFRLCSVVALRNRLLPQTDTFLKAAIQLIADVPAFEKIDHKKVPTEGKLISTLLSLMSTFVVVPGHPEHGPFYLVKGLINAIERYPWKSSASKTKLFVSLVSLLSAFGQGKLIYSVPGVESNDVLYGSQSGYLNELRAYMTTVVDKCMEQLADLGGEKAQCGLVIDLLQNIVSACELNDGHGDLAKKLIQLAQKNCRETTWVRGDKEHLRNVLQAIKSWAESGENLAGSRAAQKAVYASLV